MKSENGATLVAGQRGELRAAAQTGEVAA